MKAIAAVSSNGVIGKGNELPWHIPDDLEWFKKKTLNEVILMGRKTFESIGKLLPKRISVVLSRKNRLIEGVDVIHNLADIKTLNLPEDKDIWVIGGAEIYELALPYCSDLFLTHVKMDVEGGDAFFPDIDGQFKEHAVVQETEEFKILHYVNANPLPLEN